MKIIRYVSCLLLLVCINTSVQAATKIATLYVPGATSSPLTQFRFNLSILTPESVQNGVYESRSVMSTNINLVSWTGSDTAPTLKLEDISKISPSSCPGVEAYDDLSPVTGWGCNEFIIGVYYDSDLHGCPWLVSAYIQSSETYDASMGIPPFMGPTKVSSTCPAVPLTPYDISWNENYVVHDKVLRLQSTGSTIETTLSTYLMKDGKLCDGSKYDDRGAYCRWVAKMVTFTGCDNAKVSVTPTPHPVTDKQLHDMLVRVDTSSQQPLDSTCRFQYVLNML